MWKEVRDVHLCVTCHRVHQNLSLTQGNGSRALTCPRLGIPNSRKEGRKETPADPNVFALAAFFFRASTRESPHHASHSLPSLFAGPISLLMLLVCLCRCFVLCFPSLIAESISRHEKILFQHVTPAQHKLLVCSHRCILSDTFISENGRVSKALYVMNIQLLRHAVGQHSFFWNVS